MKKLLETLYITTPESYLFERNGNICISIGGAEKAAVPITQVNSIVLHFSARTAFFWGGYAARSAEMCC